MVTVGAATTGHTRRTAMGSKSDKIKGRVKEALGALTDNDRLKREGQRDQVVGKVKDKVERVAEKVKDKAKRAVEKVRNA
jgi:uncharacterized protein YjbJ (UPF0337 family)